LKGQSTAIHATILGAESIPASAWRAGFDKDLDSPQRLAETVPASALTADKPGVIALRVQNKSQDTIALSDAKANQVMKLLRREDFSGGSYTYDGKVKSLRAGTFHVEVIVTPLLAPIQGEAPVR
jgi:hypothetical protein